MSNKKKAKMPRLTYFFYHGELHKKLHINRSEDIVTAWSYPRGQAVKYSYSDVRKNGGRAYSTKQVCQMVRRGSTVISVAIANGNIREPQRTYGLDADRNPYAYYWSEDDIMKLHDYLLTVHRGRPRKDGLIATQADTPTRSELRAMIRQETILYVKNSEGEFVPTWQAETL